MEKLPDEDIGVRNEKVGRLFAIYETSMYRQALKILRNVDSAEDAVQTTFLRVMENMDKIKDIYSRDTRSYLYTILNNTCFNILRAAKKYTYTDTYSEHCEPVYVEKEEDFIAFNKLVSEIKKLPKLYSEILLLVGVKDMSVGSSAKLLGITDQAARQRLCRARSKIKVLLQNGE